MNPAIETLNHLGEAMLRFAWTMLWQSSVLIVILFAADIALRRHVRAAVRYAFWLVVLLKLLLPPSLALPTGLAWWLFPAASTPGKPQTTRFTISYGTDATPNLPLQRLATARPPSRLTLSAAAWAFLGWSVISFGLLAWLMMRWRQVLGKVRRATPPAAWLGELFKDARLSIGLRRSVCLRLTDQTMSPAVCGLVRPLILLPQSLIEKLSPSQLRAVLLHELVHLRRGDLWTNCAQALVQIVYWWHPLLWLANARIRRVREESVDDVVMLTLRNDAGVYAPTLLEVAKLAFHRPLASLGLVGILESRSALRQRIERLVNFHAPRKAGLTLMSLCGIFIFSAVAVPMGEAPAPSSDTSDFDRKENVPDKVVEADRLVRDAKLLYEMGKFDDAGNLLASALTREPENQEAHYYMDLVQTAKANRQWLSGIVRTSPGRKDIVDKLNRIRFDQVSWPDGLPLSEVLRNLSDQTRLRDPDKKGINFTFHTNAPAASAVTASADGTTAINPITGLPEATSADVAVDASSINVKLTLTDIRLADLLDAIVLVADHPIQYSILDDGIVFSTRGSNPAPLETRTFKVDATVFLAALQKQTGLQTNVSAALNRLLSNVGVDLSPPKSIFYNNRLGMLFVRATGQDLDTAEKVVQVLNYTPPPQIHIKARFIVLPGPATTDLYLGNFNASNINIHSAPDANALPARDPINRPESVAGENKPSSITGILNKPQFQTVLQALRSNASAELLAEPEVTTVSGRQTEMRATDTISVMTGIRPQALTAPGVDSANATNYLQTEKVETGPVFDVLPKVRDDGYAIDLSLMASLTEFLGYAEAQTNLATIYVNGRQQQVPVPQPRFQTFRLQTPITVWDGQTVILGGLISSQVQTTADTEPKAGNGKAGEILVREQIVRTFQKKQLLVLITATLVDAAGNRIHSDEDMLFAPNSVPPQHSP